MYTRAELLQGELVVPLYLRSTADEASDEAYGNSRPQELMRPLMRSTGSLDVYKLEPRDNPHKKYRLICLSRKESLFHQLSLSLSPFLRLFRVVCREAVLCVPQAPAPPNASQASQQRASLVVTNYR